MPDPQIVHVVDSDPAIGNALGALLDRYGIGVRAYADASEFLDAVAAGQTDDGCLLVEADLPDVSGWSLLEMLQRQAFPLPVIVLTGEGGPDIYARAQGLGATDVLEKPLLTAFVLDRLAQLIPGGINPEMPAPGTVTLPDGTEVAFRVMRPEDADSLQEFVRGLSDRSRYLRFFSNIKHLSPSMLERLTHYDYPHSYSLVATVMEEDREKQIGVARYAPAELDGAAEFAVVVADAWQGRGIARIMLRGLTTAATVAGVRSLEGLVLRENKSMQTLAKSLGFAVLQNDGDATIVRVVKTLNVPAGTETQTHASD